MRTSTSCLFLSTLLSTLACGDRDTADTTGGDATSGASTGPASTADEPTTAAPSTTAPITDTTAPADPDTSSGATTGSSSTATGGPACAGELPPHWIDGTDCGAEPTIQVHAYDDATMILRQSLCTSFEGPFMYLLFGTERALLLDTGDGGIPIADVVHELVAEWSQAHGHPGLELIVANSHAHGDHTAGNDLFIGAADTTIVGVGVANVAAFFGIADWPGQIVELDLGGRVLDVVPIPGHEAAHIALFDRNTGVVLTGDTLYPGRLYIKDFPAYVASVGRLVDHLAGHEVCRVLGAHIEMTTTPGEDFDFMQPSHPDEHPLELDLAHLLELRAAVEAMAAPAIEVHDDFIVYPL